jgi:hypothetical protein
LGVWKHTPIFALSINNLNLSVMGYRWKPNASQRAAYREKMIERDSLPINNSGKAIREGCWVKYYSVNKGCIVEGYVINSSYGADKGQHTFTIDWNGDKVLVKGRNLYPNIIEHRQGEISLQDSV